LTGVARIRQNGEWSNAVAFTVPATGGNTLSPSVLTLVVGDTHTIRALGGDGHAVSGLTWNSSDTSVVSLSGDDPPLLTALGRRTGHHHGGHRLGRCHGVGGLAARRNGAVVELRRRFRCLFHCARVTQSQRRGAFIGMASRAEGGQRYVQGGFSVRLVRIR